jgi:hypothetical protein
VFLAIQGCVEPAVLEFVPQVIRQGVGPLLLGVGDFAAGIVITEKPRLRLQRQLVLRCQLVLHVFGRRGENPDR